MTKRSIHIFLFALVAAPPVCAQRAGAISVYKVDFDEPDFNQGSRTKDFTVGDQLILSLSGKARVPASFHARFFYGSKEDLINNARGRQLDDKCVSFETLVLTVRAVGNVDFHASPDQTWLAQGLGAQVYTVVFEAGGEPSDSYIRLSYNDLEKVYFRDAVQIRVNPDSKKLRPEIKRQIEATLDQRTQTMKNDQGQMDLKRPSQSPCWSASLRQPERASKASAFTLVSVLSTKSCSDSPSAIRSFEAEAASMGAMAGQ